MYGLLVEQGICGAGTRRDDTEDIAEDTPVVTVHQGGTFVRNPKLWPNKRHTCVRVTEY
jgi:hypothetical protein